MTSLALINELIGLPANASEHGYQIDHIIEFCHWFMGALFLGWSAFFLFVLWRFHKGRNPVANHDGVTSGISTHLEFAVVLIEAVLLVGFAIPLWAKRVNAFPENKDAILVHAIGQQFNWNFHLPGPDGVFGRRELALVSNSNAIGLDSSDPAAKDDIVVLGELHVPVDRTVIIDVSSKDVIHNFCLPDMRIAQDAIPGQVIPMWFRPIKTGTFEVVCGQLCGLGHYAMKGTLVVDTPEEYQAWLKERVELSGNQTAPSAPQPPPADRRSSQPPAPCRRRALRRQPTPAADKNGDRRRAGIIPQTMRTPAADTNPFLHRFAWFTAGATLLLICSGGMVTSKGVGLAVPDWPTTFGYNMFFFPVSKWVGGIFFEHTHRLIASVIGFLSIILAIWLAFSKADRWIKILGWASLGAVVLQGILGGLRVTLLKDQIGIFHACLAQAFLALLVIIALATSPIWRRLSRFGGAVPRRSLAILALVISGLIYGQLALGATMRHQHRDLAILDFPLAYGQLVPATDSATIARINQARDAQALSDVSAGQIWLQMAHRLLAALIGLAIAVFWLLIRREKTVISFLRNLTDLWLGLVILQIALGAWTIWSNKAADIATAHVAVGAITFAVAIVISATFLRLRHVTAEASPTVPTSNLAEAGAT